MFFRVLGALALISVAGDGTPTNAPDTIGESYALQLAAIRAGSGGKASLEELLEEVRAMKRVLLRSVGDVGAIEKLSDEQFERVGALAEGVIVNRHEVLIVEPDSQFFLALAKKFARPEDIAFFQALDSTYRGSWWPSYMQDFSHISGCTDFGSGELVARYRAWLAFRSRYPRAYVDETEEQMREIERQVSEGTCACGDQASVVRELKEFARAFPASPVRSVMKKRIDAITRGRSGVQFNCSPG